MTLLDIIDQDLEDVFFNTDDFAIDAVWTPSGGSATPIVLIFDDEYIGTNLGTGEIDNADPQARIKSDTVTGITEDDVIVAKSTTYYVKSPQPDGTGVILVTLSKRQMNNG